MATETTVSGNGKTATYTAPPPDDAVQTSQVGGTAEVQDDADLTVSHQSDQLTAAQNAGLITSDDLETPKTLGDLSLAVSTLFADLTQTQAKDTEDMLEDTGKKIQENNHKRMERVAEMQKLLKQHEQKQNGILAGEICGIIGGALIAGLSLGTLGPVGTTVMVTSVALATATQVAQMAGGFDALAKKDGSKAAQGLMYGMLAGSVLLAVGTGGASLASSLGSASGAAATAGEAAAETGAAMSEASTSAEAADTLVEGVSEMRTTLETAGTDATEAGAETAEAPEAFTNDAGDIADSGADVAKTGDVDNAAADAADADTDVNELAKGVDDSVDVAAQAKPEAGPEEDVEGAETTTEKEGASKLQKAAKYGRRAGQAMQYAAEIEEGATRMEQGIIEKKEDDVQGDVQKIAADTQNERSIQSEMSEAMVDIIETLNQVFGWMRDHETSLTKTQKASISAIGGTGETA